MKILITGNSGYIGSHLSQIISKKDIEIYGLDKNVPKFNILTHFQEDIRFDSNHWKASDIEFDCVIHLAAEVSVSESVKTPTNYYLTNTLGTLNCIEKLKFKNFIFASTGAAEGLDSPYGISKRMAEDIVREKCSDRKIPFTIFRFYNVVGTDGFHPTNPDGLFSNLIAAIDKQNFKIFGGDYNTKDGTCVRDYVHVNEICHAIVSSIFQSTNQIENLGHGVGTTVKEMVEIFKQVNNCDFVVTVVERRAGDIESSVLKNPSSFMKKIYTLEQLLKI